jgi:hypothetical protein
MASPAQALVHNWRLKLSALGLSVFLWALVQTEPSNQETLTAVPVHVQMADTGWTTSGPPAPSSIEIRLGGPARDILRVAREGASIRIPVGSVGSQDTVVTLRREWVQFAPRSGLTVESMSPVSVRISFERAQTRLVPVAMRVAGRVRDGLALAAEAELNPRMVRVRGPASRVAGLDSLRMLPFDLSDVDGSGAFTVTVDTVGLLGASIVPSSVTLELRVEELVERVLDGIAVRLDAGSGAEELVVDLAEIGVRLSGPRSLVTSLDPERLSVRVSSDTLRGMTPGEERLVRVQVVGVPPLVTATPDTDRIAVRRKIDVTAGGQAGARSGPGFP